MVTVAVILCITLIVCIGQTWGHVSLHEPPQRSSMWRYGFDTPKNFNDNALNCGGFSTQWDTYGGLCGICGDSYGDPQPRANEAGGTYGNGIITRTYTQGQVIDVTVLLKAYHKGYFMFKICPNNNVSVEVTQECLDLTVLNYVSASGEDLGDKFYTDKRKGDKNLKLQLPSDMTCTQCVLQLTYHTANRHGCDFDDPTNCCVGCGEQEHFINCSDIAITAA